MVDGEFAKNCQSGKSAFYDPPKKLDLELLKGLFVFEYDFRVSSPCLIVNTQ